MIAIEIKLKKLKEEYTDFYEFFKGCIDRSNSKFKDYKEEKYKAFYYIGFYLKPSEKTEKYYENLFSMKYEDRLLEEYGKARVTITIVSGKFAVSDQINELSDTVKLIIDEITVRKMVSEQGMLDEPHEEVIDSIPDYEDVLEKMREEQDSQKDFLESMGMGDLLKVKRQKELTPEERLNGLIQEEKYEEADELLDKHPELRKKDDEDK